MFDYIIIGAGSAGCGSMNRAACERPMNTKAGRTGWLRARSCLARRGPNPSIDSSPMFAVETTRAMRSTAVPQ
mgnify:CR=1 FL=1